MLALLFLLFASSFSLSFSPASPVWPFHFSQSFQETTSYPVSGSHSTSGTYFYNWTSKSSRSDRANGRYDLLCGIASIYESLNTPCSHIVVNGSRYLFYPKLDSCCYCCNETNGCGALEPDWFSRAKFTFEEVHDGLSAYRWDLNGDQQSLVYETVGDVAVNRVTVAVDQQEYSYRINFGPRNSTVPQGVFELPTQCALGIPCLSAGCVALKQRNDGNNYGAGERIKL
jgi:hypothetical protein